MKRVKSVIKGAVFLCLLLAAFLGVNELLRPIPVNTQAYGIDQEPENTVDVVIVGSSHVYSNINPNVLWAQYGIAGYNYASSAQNLAAGYYYVQDALRTQSPRVVAVDLFSLLYPDGNDTMSEPELLWAADLMPFSTVKLAMLEELAPEGESGLKYLLGTGYNHTRWQMLSRDGAFLNRDEAATNRLKGYNTINDLQVGEVQAPTLPYPSTQEAAALSPFDTEQMQRLVALAKEEGFQLLFFKAPMINVFLEEDMQRQLNAAERFAAENGAGFLDMNRHYEEMGLDNTADFADYTHLNRTGAEKASAFLGRWLQQAYGLDDRRGQAGYESWDMAAAGYQQVILLEGMLATTDPAVYFTSLAKLEGGFLVALAANGGLGEASAALTPLLETLGLAPDDPEALAQGHSYAGVMAPGLAWAKANAAPLALEVPGHDLPVSVKVTSGGAGYGEAASITIDGAEYAPDKPGLAVVVYDMDRAEVVDILTLQAAEGALHLVRPEQEGL